MAKGQHQQYQFSQLNINQGLSHNQVNDIFKDSRGFMWFSTASGLNRYDGYELEVYKIHPHDSSSLGDDYVSRVVEGPENKLIVFTQKGINIYDPLTERFQQNATAYFEHLNVDLATCQSVFKSNTCYWFNNGIKGLYCYNPLTHKTKHLTYGKNNVSDVATGRVTSITADTKGNCWIMHDSGVIEEIDCNLKVLKSYHVFAGNAASKDYQLFVDAAGDFWIYCASEEYGVDFYSPSSGLSKHLSKDTHKLSNDLVTGIVQDKNGLVWVATDHGGINIVDKQNFNVRYLSNKEDDDKTIGQNSITKVYKDTEGIIWVGTFKKGVSYYHKDIIKFPLYRHLFSDKNSLPGNDVNCFIEDKAGNVWIGTNGNGLLCFNRKSGIYTVYKHGTDRSSLSNDVIVSLCIDHEDQLWIGTYLGGLDKFDGKRFSHYTHQDKSNNSLSDDRVWEIMENTDHSLWIGTLSGGVDLLSPDRRHFTHYNTRVPNTLNSDNVFTINRDHQGKIWLGTSNGVNVFDAVKKKFRYYTSTADNTSLSNNNIINIIEDSRHLTWVGTRHGLNVFDPATEKFTRLCSVDGLPDNTILTILEDNQHRMWVSTPNGLSSIIVSGNKQQGYHFRFKNYSQADGLQGREFNENAAYKLRSGELIFGGANGFNLFNPANISNCSKLPSAILTDFQVLNHSIAVGEAVNSHVLLSQAISSAKSLTLHYNENVFSLAFASLNFFNPDKTKYAYKLEGFDKQWQVVASNARKATYTNLDPGTYVFKVKAINEAGVMSTKPTSLTVTVLPPFWRTPLAYVLYFVVIAGALFYSRFQSIKKLKLDFALQQERQEAQRMHELDMMKIKFFTNVSHEFRTPLSLIITPLEKMLKSKQDGNHHNLELIHRNARRLLNLVNQLLDFRKMEVQELKLNLVPGDVIKFIHDISHSFTDIAEKKDISFAFKSGKESLYTFFDHDKLERILFNLLSNAFKFTPQSGHIGVEVATANLNASKQHEIEIKISDTGIGIEADKIDRIFDRFFQNDLNGSLVNQGSGIGLSIAKEFVRMHGGGIKVDSQPGYGSTFTLTLLLTEAAVPAINLPHNLAHQPSANSVPKNEILEEQQKELIPLDGKKPLILLVEDNEDFRFYLKDNLKEHYTVAEAVNGKEGWQKALALHPCIVVSDISMPYMNGIELVEKMRHDKRTQHTPVILLTALTGEEQQLAGLESGANDYVTKPFNFEILLSKIKNQLQQQQSYRKTYQKQVEVKTSDIEVLNADERFVQRALAVVEANLANTEFSVDKLSQEMNMSRVALYKRLLALTGQSPIEFIRNIRLKRAEQLLIKSKLTVSEVAYEVGFGNPKAMTKYFKKEFNKLPSDYLNSRT
uniref:hybrid sensor histidine kinase/response regulator n=1 Tax=Mucilaginibacter sp. Bleaf8 TaxID=2834430 RepID=UPI0020C05741|nr:two-component regulator propeller domain-containing protein [Mucilaginibacter sp. Bleaf8]